MKLKKYFVIIIIIIIILSVGKTLAYWSGFNVEPINTELNNLYVGEWLFSEHPGYINFEDITWGDEKGSILINGIDWKRYDVIIVKYKTQGYEHYYKLNLFDDSVIGNWCRPWENKGGGIKPTFPPCFPPDQPPHGGKRPYVPLFFYYLKDNQYSEDIVTSATLKNPETSEMERMFFYSNAISWSNPTLEPHKGWCLIEKYGVNTSVDSACLKKSFVYGKDNKIYKNMSTLPILERNEPSNENNYNWNVYPEDFTYYNRNLYNKYDVVFVKESGHWYFNYSDNPIRGIDPSDDRYWMLAHLPYREKNNEK